MRFKPYTGLSSLILLAATGRRPLSLKIANMDGAKLSAAHMAVDKYVKVMCDPGSLSQANTWQKFPLTLENLL